MLSDIRFSGRIRIGTRFRKNPGQHFEERWKVVNIFDRHGVRMYVLEMWLRRKRRWVYEVEPEYILRNFYHPWNHGKR